MYRVENLVVFTVILMGIVAIIEVDTIKESYCLKEILFFKFAVVNPLPNVATYLSLSEFN